jgi:glycosyltransferase involved in cell wall biosynthesis
MLGILGRFARRQRREWGDAVRHARATAEVLGLAKWVRSWRPGPPGRRLGLRLAAYRHAETAALYRPMARGLAASLAAEPPLPWRDYRISWDRYPSALAAPRLDRTLILKAPRPGGEKGVLLVHLEYNWLRLLAAAGDAGFLDDRYAVILSTGWSSTDYGLLAMALGALKGRVYVQASNSAEVAKIEAFSPRVRCLPTIGCDWIDPAFYRPKPFGERATDIVMVANWAPFKRHWHLFKALRRMPRSLRVTLIGQDDGPFTLDRVRQQAREYGVPQDVRFLTNVTVEEVQGHLCDSKVSLILSRREGHCVAVAESLFADTPVGLLRGAHIGPLAYINPETGAVLGHGRLDRHLARFLETADRCRARRWAEEHIACTRSLDRVARFLAEDARKQQLPWTAGPEPICWRPYPAYTAGADRRALAPFWDDLHRHYPAAFGAELPAAASGPGG